MLAGALLLAIGVFMPLASLPIVGNFNYMSRGRGDGMVVLLLALVIGGLVIFSFRLVAAVLGLAVAGVMATTFVTLLNVLHEMDVKAADLAKDNPFGVLAVAFARNSGMEWGWVPLFAGVVMIIVAGFTAPRGSNLLSSPGRATEPSGETSGFDPDAMVRNTLIRRAILPRSMRDGQTRVMLNLVAPSLGLTQRQAPIQMKYQLGYFGEA